MANMIQGTSNVLTKQITFRPQSFTSTGAGVTCNLYPYGSNQISARLDVGAVNTLTSLAVKIQVSVDDSTWVDVSGATFTTVTAANAGETIDFFVPMASSTTASPYIYVRAYATLTGTSALISCLIEGSTKMGATNAWSNSPPTNN